MKELVRMFNTKPSNFDKTFEAKWDELGPFDLERFIKEGKVKLSDEKVDTKVGKNEVW